MTTHHQELRTAIGTIARYWPRGWTLDRTDAYARALQTHTPDTITQAVETLATTWKGTEAPNPHYIDDACRTIERAQRTADPNNTGDGKGCPHCRHQHGDHAVDAGHHEPWRGDGKLIYCETHRVMWPGTTHDPNTIDDGGPMNPDEWRDRALAGEYGHVLQTAAARGATPATAIPAATPPIRLDEALV